MGNAADILAPGIVGAVAHLGVSRDMIEGQPVEPVSSSKFVALYHAAISASICGFFAQPFEGSLPAKEPAGRAALTPKS